MPQVPYHKSRKRTWESQRYSITEKNKDWTQNTNRMHIFTRDHGVCGICHQPIEGNFQIDHIVPLNAGGRHEENNLQVAHEHCNKVKADKYDG